MVDDRQQGALRAPQRRGSALRRAPARLAATGSRGLVERVGAGRYDIVGIPRAVRGEFSSRSAEIRSELATVVGRRGPPHRCVGEHPEPKGTSVTMHSARAGRTGWRRWASNRRIWRQSCPPVPTGQHRPTRRVARRGRVRQLLGRSADGVVTRRAVVEAWARASPDGASAVQIDAAAEVWAPTHGELGVSERPRRAAPWSSRRRCSSASARGLRSQTARLATRRSVRLTAYRRRWGSRARGECDTAGSRGHAGEAPARAPRMRTCDR